MSSADAKRSLSIPLLIPLLLPPNPRLLTALRICLRFLTPKVKKNSPLLPSVSDAPPCSHQLRLLMRLSSGSVLLTMCMSRRSENFPNFPLTNSTAQNNKKDKEIRKKSDTNMKHPQIITYKKAMGEVILGNLTPLAKSIKR